MTVKFKFDYVLNLHSRNTYIIAIERDGMDEEMAFKKALIQVNKLDIKSINKASDGSAVITMRGNVPPLKTLESHDDIIDTIKRANLALDIMQKDKVYMFDNFEVDTDELSIIEGWNEKKTTTKKKKK